MHARGLPSACMRAQVSSLEEADSKIDALAKSGALDPALLLTMAKAYAAAKETDKTKEEVKDIMAHLYFKVGLRWCLPPVSSLQPLPALGSFLPSLLSLQHLPELKIAFPAHSPLCSTCLSCSLVQHPCWLRGSETHRHAHDSRPSTLQHVLRFGQVDAGPCGKQARCCGGGPQLSQFLHGRRPCRHPVRQDNSSVLH